MSKAGSPKLVEEHVHIVSGDRKSNGHFTCLSLSSLYCKLMQSWCENWLHNEGRSLRNPKLS